jgi:hypothetical protein
MGLLDNALQALKSQYQETKGNVGLLMSDPRQYMSGLNQDAAEYNRLSSLALQAERNAYRGIPVSPEQAAAKQYIDQQQQDMALGFTGSINPTGKFLNQAQQTASINAEKMLGLPPGNTAMDRAKAMGFNVENPVYHGTNADIQSMNVQGKGKTSGAGAFVTNNPVIAETYLSGIGTPGGNIMPLLVKDKDLLTTNARGKNWSDIYTNQLSVKQGNKKYSLDELGLDKNSATTTDELGMIANQLGKKGIVIKNVRDAGPNSHIYRAKEYLKEKYGIYPDEQWSNVSGKQFTEARDYLDKLYKSQKSDITAIQDPTLLRSRFAAFDPARANEADLLAGVVPLGLIAGKDQLELKKEKKPKK